MKLNEYAGDCAVCGVRVEPQGGHLKREAGGWTIRHEACPAPARRTYRQQMLDGPRRFAGQTPGSTPELRPECGTVAGFEAHQSHGERACLLCKKTIGISLREIDPKPMVELIAAVRRRL